MQKKIIVLAIAAALTAPAAFAADASNVTVYGKVFANYENIKSSNVGAAQSLTMNRIVSDATRFGVKGKEDLGDGLNAIWQLEAQFNVDGAAGPTNNTNGFGAGTRNSHVGLEGDFGTAFLGRWDSPYKVAHNKIELFDNTTVFSSNNIIGTNSSVGSDFNNRISNSVQYWTPKMNGFQAKVALGTDPAQTAGAAGTNKKTLALNATYENDMFYGAAAYQKFNDVAGANTSRSGNRLVGAFKFDGGLIGATYEALDNKTAAAVTTKRTSWELMGEYAVGANNFGLTYAVAGNLGGVAATGAKNLSVKYGYKFSKRTEIFAAYTALTNDASAAYNFNHGPMATTAGTVGAKLSGFGVGMVHSF